MNTIILVLFTILLLYLARLSLKSSFRDWQSIFQRRADKKYNRERSVIEQARKNKNRRPSYKVDYINKDTEQLSAFIINGDLNEHDIQHLSFLNKKDFYIVKGWHSLVVELLVELEKIGWKREISLTYDRGTLDIEIAEKTPNHRAILTKIRDKSRQICKVCGEQGLIRGPDKHNLATCYIHYLESETRIVTNDSGFSLNYRNSEAINWNMISDARLNIYGSRDSIMSIEFTLFARELEDNERNKIVSISSYYIGFGQFLSNIPPGYPSLNYELIKKRYGEVKACPICGYNALYDTECECCNNELYNVKTSDGQMTELEYYKDAQMNWKMEIGDLKLGGHPYYNLGKGYEIRFTNEELDEFQKGWKYDD